MYMRSFTTKEWSMSQVLVASDSKTGNMLGWSVVTSDLVIAASAYGYNTNGFTTCKSILY